MENYHVLNFTGNELYKLYQIFTVSFYLIFWLSRLILLPADDLQLSEMKKIAIEAWAPSLQRYLQVMM